MEYWTILDKPTRLASALIYTILQFFTCRALNSFLQGGGEALAPNPVGRIADEEKCQSFEGSVMNTLILVKDSKHGSYSW